MVLARDEYKCQHVREDTGVLCGRWANQVDHVVNHAEGGDDSLGNLQALCAYHHRVKSAREGVRGGERRRVRLAEEKRYQHPAFL